MNKKDMLYFDAPAVDFFESVPIGNGRLGALIYGEVMREQVVLNENTVWSGCREDANREDARDYLPQIRRLLQEGKNYEAERLFAEHFTCKGLGSNYGHGADAPFGCYQVLGRLMLSYFQALSSGRESCYAVQDYRRTLDLSDGVARVSFTASGVRYQRERIAAKAENAVYMNLTASEAGKIYFSLGLDRDERACGWRGRMKRRLWSRCAPICPDS